MIINITDLAKAALNDMFKNYNISRKIHKSIFKRNCLIWPYI